MSAAKSGCRAACVALLLAACDGGGNGRPEEPQLPLLFELNAAAQTGQDDLAVECALGFIVEISGEVSRTREVVEYIATMGGEANRSVLRPDGSGVAFRADAFYPRLQVLHLLPNRVQLVSLDFPPDGPPTGSRFWDELRFFDGFLNADGTIEGDWLCAPLDTEQGGVNDNSVFAEGTWATTELDSAGR